jgi:hypothetical protein
MLSMASARPDRLLSPADLTRPVALLAVYSVIRDETIRPGLPAGCDRCGAPAVRLARIVYGFTGKIGLVGEVYHGGCGIVPGAPTWVCRACGRWGGGWLWPCASS